MVRRGRVWHGVVWLGLGILTLIRSGAVWSGAVGYGKGSILMWHGLVR